MRKKYVKIAALACALVICFLLVFFTAAKKEGRFAQVGAEEKSFYTFLVCGLDKASENTDVMMLVSVDTETGGINILQIPRDTFVNPESSGLGVTRVNAVYAALKARGEKNAAKALCETLENSLCVKIDRYVIMDTSAFSSMIDAVGGIEYDVPFDMHYDDPFQGLHIHIEAGRQLLDGKKAEQFIRYRAGYATGDIGRTAARGDFLREMITQVKEKLSLAGAVRIASELASHVTTNVGTGEIFFWAAKLYSAGEESLKIKTIAGSALQNPKTGAWIYFAINKRAALDDINEYATPNDTEILYEDFDKNAIFTDDPKGQNPYISKYYYSKIKKE